MKRRDFLIGAAALAVVGPATTHTFEAVSFGNPNAARATIGHFYIGSKANLFVLLDDGWKSIGEVKEFAIS